MNATIGFLPSSASGASAYTPVVNDAGNTTLTPGRGPQIVALTVTGTARTSKIILEAGGAAAGDQLIVQATLPTTPAIALDFRNATAEGTALLPAERFPDQLYTTDGVTTTATLAFVFDGAAWSYLQSTSPA